MYQRNYHQSWWHKTEWRIHFWSFPNWLLTILNFLADVNFIEQNGHRPEFQLEIPVKLKTGVICWISDLTMPYLTKTDHRTYFKSNLKKPIMTDFAISLGPAYAKKRLIISKFCYFFQKKSHLMAVSGQTFNNYNASIKCSIQSHEFKVVFATSGSFWTNLQTRYKLTNY